MPELLLHYIWYKALFDAYPQYTTDGRRVEVISTGEHNVHSGPDFTGVRLRFYPAGELFSEPVDLVGDIEIHLRSSDWYRHHHERNPHYDGILLHVVRLADCEVRNSRGEVLPQMELQYPVHQDYISSMIRDMRHMDSLLSRLPCSHSLFDDPGLISDSWRERLLLQRMECRRSSIHRLLERLEQNWEEAFYVSLSRSFGFHTNATPFEMMALQTPLACLRKHRDHLDQITAVLLGQSGLMLREDPLYDEYQFLRAAFSLTPIAPTLWKQSRMRPQNRPEGRIRQLAELIHRSEFLFTRLMQADTIDAMRQILSVPGLGTTAVDTLIINTVLPYQYAWGMYRRCPDAAADAYHRMSMIAAEDNSIIRQWKALGQTAESAADTQALIHLYQSYCQQEGCLQCEVAYYAFLPTALQSS